MQIGVQYVKHRERSAHYIESAQGAQYDAVVHIDVVNRVCSCWSWSCLVLSVAVRTVVADAGCGSCVRIAFCIRASWAACTRRRRRVFEVVHALCSRALLMQTSALRPLDGGFGDGAAATGAAAMDEDDD